MKLIICVALFTFVGATPLNRSAVNDSEAFVNKGNWRLIPDADYKLHLIDIDAVDMEIEPAFVGLADIVFRLFTRSNPTIPQVIPIDNAAALQASFFNPAHPARFHIHGWNQGGPNTANNYRDAYLAQGNFNVFVVDWGVGAQTPNYILARGRVGETGRVVARFIDFLVANGLPYSAVTVLGHSLGAHCAGHAGKAVQGRLPVIVALDPAGPLFSFDNPADRVDHTDATHVEVLATDIVFLGFDLPIGHANFYPNWGTAQPGCEGEVGGVCSHIIVAQFMVESINPARVFGGIRCRDFNDIRNRNCVVSGPSRRMGGEPVVIDGTSPPGSVYFLTTNPASPFSQGPR